MPSAIEPEPGMFAIASRASEHCTDQEPVFGQVVPCEAGVT